MKAISIKVYLSLLSIGIVVTIAAIVIFLIMPALNTISDLKAALQLEQLTSLATSAVRERQEQQLAQLDGIEVEVKTIDQRVRSHLSVLETITTFETLAEQYHIDQQLDVVSADTKSYTLSITTLGTYTDHLAYLKAISQLPFAVIIPKMTLTARQSSVNGHFTATIYVTAN